MAGAGEGAGVAAAGRADVSPGRASGSGVESCGSLRITLTRSGVGPGAAVLWNTWSMWFSLTTAGRCCDGRCCCAGCADGGLGAATAGRPGIAASAEPAELSDT